MTTYWACLYCVMERGLRGDEIPDLPLAGDTQAIAHHIESVHHIPVVRDGETLEEARARFAKEQPEAADPATCRCPQCVRERAKQNWQ